MKKALLPVIAILLVLILVGGVFYSVHPNEYAAVRQFGRIVKIESEQGLHTKLPFVQSVQKISSAIALYDVPASDVITKDKKTMISDNFILWRVTDPLKYVQTLGAVDARAEERIEAAVYNSLKKVISGMTQDEIIASRGDKLNNMITEDANADVQVYGIEIIQSQIKALDLPDDNKSAVYGRMISERENIAAGYTAEGKAEAQKIKNDTDRQASIMAAEAEKEAAQIVAEGEAEYMRILSEAYNTQDKADFYNFLRSLDAAKVALSGGNKTIILDKDSELVQIIYGNVP